MLTRRAMLAQGTTLLLLVPVIGCSMNSSGSTAPPPPPGPGGVTCAGTNVVSSVDASHTHTVCVLDSDLASPPLAGVTYTTSTDGGHTHKVMLAHDDLAAIHAGQTVTVTTTSDVDPVNGADHSHMFAIMKGTGTGGGSGDPGSGGW